MTPSANLTAEALNKIESGARAGLPPEFPAVNTPQWMRNIGFIHSSDVEEWTSTVSRTRARWKSLRPVYFGKEAFYRLSDIKRHLEIKADQNMDTEEMVSL
jgi:hypothetical protein